MKKTKITIITKAEQIQNLKKIKVKNKRYFKPKTQVVKSITQIITDYLSGLGFKPYCKDLNGTILIAPIAPSAKNYLLVFITNDLITFRQGFWKNQKFSGRKITQCLPTELQETLAGWTNKTICNGIGSAVYRQNAPTTQYSLIHRQLSNKLPFLNPQNRYHDPNNHRDQRRQRILRL